MSKYILNGKIIITTKIIILKPQEIYIFKFWRLKYNQNNIKNYRFHWIFIFIFCFKHAIELWLIFFLLLTIGSCLEIHSFLKLTFDSLKSDFGPIITKIITILILNIETNSKKMGKLHKQSNFTRKWNGFSYF